MTTYNDTVLLDSALNRISSIPIDYYSKNSYVMWTGYVFNDTAITIDDCKISTISEFNGVFYITGGGITGFTPILSDWDTACNIGSITGGEMKQITLRVFISGGSALTSLHSVPLYISK